MLICDFDNTLYDWVEYFVTSFYEMIDEAYTIIGCNREVLLDDIREVHRRYRDSEHPFALLEAQCVLNRFPNLTPKERATALDSAFYAFNRARKRSLKLYPDVESTLLVLKGKGIRIVGHTEAKFLAVLDRLQRLGLGELFDRVYCRERSTSSHPRVADVKKWVEESASSKVIELAHHQSKPSVEVLTEICEREGYCPSTVAYVGDSLFKDIMMANRAGVMSIWAKYGVTTSKKRYDDLVRVSHWSDADVANETAIRRGAGAVIPDWTLEHSFSEILPILKANAD